MATPLFCVDLSEDARDYRHTALEPGLPLLDRQHVNFQILRKWLGDYIAEPEWRNEDVVAFYMSEEERGRLEDVDCQPVTRGELEKKFADDLESIRVKIKKIRPESSTEQMVHRILKKNIAEQANDLENSDFDSYFFKCRANNEDWRLIWCCGFQRSDLEPLKAKLWHTPDGDFLGVRPPLQGGRVKKRKRTGLGVLASPWLAIALILLLAAFLAATWPKLVVTPNDLTVPLGSRIEFKVDDHRWYFFKDDVTPRALAQSNDPRIVEFDRHGAVANAMDIGQTYVSFRVGSKIIDALVKVTEAAPPDSLVIEPTDNVKVPIGATRNLKAIGHYADGSKVDLTTQVSWSEQDDSDLLVFGEEDKGLIQGDGVGTTKVFAEYPIPRDDDTYAKTSIGVQVVQAEFTSLRVALQPGTFAVGQSSRVEVFGVDKSGEEHSLTGSSLLSYKVQPTTAADVEGTYLVGATEGSGEVQITYADMAKNAAFTVDGRMLSEDVFLVSPTKIDNAIVHELIPLNVTTGTDEPIKAVTANGEVVDVFRTEDENAGYEVWLAARGLGQTEVTVSQGSKSAVVNVTVVEGSIASMQFNPPVYSLRVGQAETAGLEGTTDKQRLIKVVPDAVVWERQPRVENVQVDKATLRMDPLEATEVVQDMQVRLVSTDLLADATVTVSGGLTSIAMLDEGFGVHPPISRAGTRITDGLLLDPGRGGLIIDEGNPFGLFGEIPKGARVVEHNGIRLDGMSEADLLAYFGNNRIGDGDFIRYMGDDGLLVGSMLGDGGVGALIDFKVLDIAAADVKPESFTAELRLYLRQAGNYRLTDAAFTPLSEWNAHTSDATPLVITPSLARNADDDYELYYERQIADQTKRFQISFNLGRLAQRVVETVDVAPVLNTGPDIIVDPRPDPVIVDDNGGGRKVIRKTTRIRRSGDGASVIRSGGDTVVVSDGGTGTRVVSPSGTGTRVVSAPGSSVAGSPGSGSPSPGSPSPGSPSPGTPSPNSPSPASPSPSPSPASPSPPSPSPSSPSPASPSPAPAKPASPNPKPSPAPASPSPADPKPSPAPASPSPKPQGSDTRAPAAPAKPTPAKPTPAKPTPASPALAKPTPSGSDTRAPSPFRPRTPAGTEGQPASAYGNPVPAGSGTRTAGTPAAGRITGAAAGAAKTMPPTYTGREPSKTTSKDGDKEKNPLLEALERFRQDRKKLENITGKGRVPVIKSSKDDD